MQAHRFNVTVEKNHQLRLDLPTDFPAGPAEVIVLAEHPKARRVVRLGGVLQGEGVAAAAGDPIANALADLRAEREDQLTRRAGRHDASEDS